MVDNLQDLSSAAKPSHDLLHISAPWHNSVVQVLGSDMTFVTKSKVVQQALRLNQIRGHWVKGDLGRGIGGYFQIEIPETLKTEVTVTTNPKSSVAPSVKEKVPSIVEKTSTGASKERRSCLTFFIGGIKALLRQCKIRASPPCTEPKVTIQSFLEVETFYGERAESQYGKDR